ncbi:MAG: rhomboid family intramembrane serine protease [Nitrospinaceae bacterium]|nr:rhomboid family intramembrane serine protease [Nitrospinaceae bacterium]NIR53554.1 rhomboid family intramembrane serine protease [Nitrospinaceae bacterium]NIS83955.1 rhomboid family intramembrane serine protease [Nitrospinaceae bacterium]NIT80764.1 rhomboid family intramembrane serine protease [Nitrospinaceae bacterium]NIU43070.1 rhomboid family intramembrane serine protease [Nitrospinaceae bacterium]
MFFPFHDENPTRHFPLFTILLIGSNILVFFWEFQNQAQLAAVFTTYGLVPYELTHSPVQTYPSIFSAMFLHAGLAHLAGNMLYLWIFGNNIEDVLGKIRFLTFYLVCGVVAALCHVSMDSGSEIPMVGASGAISGVLGAYLVQFPHARVKTLLFLGFLITIVRIPAIFLLIFWLGLQILANMNSDGGGGVAWMAHIGGFVAGMILIVPFKASLKPASGAR